MPASRGIPSLASHDLASVFLSFDEPNPLRSLTNALDASSLAALSPPSCRASVVSAAPELATMGAHSGKMCIETAKPSFPWPPK